MFLGEELTDLEEDEEDADGSVGEASSIMDPLTCVQKSDVVECGGDYGKVVRGRGEEDGSEQVWRLRMLHPGLQDGSDQWCQPTAQQDCTSLLSDLKCQRLDQIHEETPTDNDHHSSLSPHLATKMSPPSAIPAHNTLNQATPASPPRSLPAKTQALPSSAGAVKTTDMLTLGSPQEWSEEPSPPLTPSLFHGIPPTIHFPLIHEKCKSHCKSVYRKHSLCQLYPPMYNSLLIKNTCIEVTAAWIFG